MGNTNDALRKGGTGGTNHRRNPRLIRHLQKQSNFVGKGKVSPSPTTSPAPVFFKPSSIPARSYGIVRDARNDRVYAPPIRSALAGVIERESRYGTNYHQNGRGIGDREASLHIFST